MRKKEEFPVSPELSKMIGPSFLILAMGLGSGEIILWPYLVANYGLGIVWGAVLGISLQFFINMEIERYALVKGESVFVGLSKIFKWTPYWFIFSTFVGFGLPGIVAASAKLFGYLLGVDNFGLIAILMLVVMGSLLTFGKTVYATMEKVTKIIIITCVPILFLLVIAVSTKQGWLALLDGLIGKGENYWFLPVGINLATFLAAFAYSGAGGNLNLTQSIYVKEKGYGMGKYSQKIGGFFRKAEEVEVDLEGALFEINEKNVNNFYSWWKKINTEHFLIFWLLGLISMLLLMLLSYLTAYGHAGNAEGINFVLREGEQLGRVIGSWGGKSLIFILSLLLFQTQLGILDSTSRIMGESLALVRQRGDGTKKMNLGKFYFVFVWSQIVFGALVLGFGIHEPKSLIVLGAIINAFAMLLHTILVFLLNRKMLPTGFGPNWRRKLATGMAILFFGFFGLVNMWGAFW